MSAASKIRAAAAASGDPEIQPQAPRPEMPPPSPAAPDMQPGQATPEEAPQLPDADVGIPPPEPEMAPPPPPPPSPSPGGAPIMALALLLAGLAIAIPGARGAALAQQAEESPLPETTPPEVEDGRPVGAPEAGELSRSEGVLAPPDAATDPGIVRPTPDAGATTMPVIPPPDGPSAE